jgi:DNA invertase Pin-like site-specific DNA recombinase
MKAVAYLRTSSGTNVGVDKDSDKRQREAIMSYAQANGIKVVAEYYDMAVSGADDVSSRPQFSNMVADILSCKGDECPDTILVETANRFARDLVVQITGHEFLKARGISLVPVDCPTHFVDETPTSVMVRNILGAVSQFERASLVHKLQVARQRVRAVKGRCEGRKARPDAHIEQARWLRSQGLPYRDISLHMERMGMLSETGGRYNPSSVKLMVVDKVRVSPYNG